eukprot:2323990-Amphidinium_carterae.1
MENCSYVHDTRAVQRITALWDMSAKLTTRKLQPLTTLKALSQRASYDSSAAPLDTIQGALCISDTSVECPYGGSGSKFCSSARKALFATTMF